MNILYLCDEYPPGRHGGIGTMVQIVAREMVKNGHKVIVAGFYDWGYGGQDSFEDEGVNVHRFRRGLSSSMLVKQDALPVRAIYKLFKISGIWQRDIERSLLKYKFFIEQIIQEHNIDLIEMPDYNDYMRFCNSYVHFPKFSKPVIVKMHGCMTYITKENGQAVPQHICQMEHDVLEQADALCSVSKYNAVKTAEYLDCKKEITVLHNGIHIPPLPQVTKEKNTVIFTGALSENKGIYQLIKAWNIVNTKLPEAKLLIFGKGPVEKISPLVAANARNSVQFHSHVKRDELFSWLAGANVGVFPSYAETFGLAPIEAMMCGTATIFTKRTSGPEIIDNGINGILVDPANPEEIADKIIYLLTNEKDRAAIAAAGQQKVLSEFDIRVLIKKYISYYNDLVSNNRMKQ